MNMNTNTKLGLPASSRADTTTTTTTTTTQQARRKTGTTYSYYLRIAILVAVLLYILWCSFAFLTTASSRYSYQYQHNDNATEHTTEQAEADAKERVSIVLEHEHVSIVLEEEHHHHHDERMCDLRDLSSHSSNNTNYTEGNRHRTNVTSQMAVADCLYFNCTKDNVTRCDNTLATNYEGYPVHDGSYDGSSDGYDSSNNDTTDTRDPPCCTHILRDMSRGFDQEMCRLGLDYAAVFGTLLGLKRADRLIPWTGDNDYALQNKTVANALVDLWDTQATGMAHIFQDINRMCATPQFAHGKLAQWSIAPTTNNTLYLEGFPYIDFYVGTESSDGWFSEIPGCRHNTSHVWPAHRVSVYRNQNGNTNTSTTTSSNTSFFQKFPANSEQLLRTYYGKNWRIPDKKKNVHGFTPCRGGHFYDS
jgi:hypothetical protein